MTRRFDREIGPSTNTIINRFHVHSLGGLMHVDFNDRGAYSYEGYFTAIRELGMGQEELGQAFRRMVFNLVAVNHDDHVKNLAFMMTPDGEWHRAPAFDVMFADGSDWMRTHQMFVNGKDIDINREDLLITGRSFDIRGGGTSTIREVANAIGTWEEEALRADVPERERAQISSLILRFQPFAFLAFCVSSLNSGRGSVWPELLIFGLGQTHFMLLYVATTYFYGMLLLALQ